MANFLLAVALALPTPLPPAIEAPPPPAVASAIVDSGQIPPAPEQVLAIPAELRRMLQTQVIAPARGPKARLDRLLAFMFDKNTGLGMEYQPDASYTVEQALRTRRANCLTFTLMSVALAREAGLPAFAQEIDRALSWDEADGNLVMQSNHVNTGVMVDGRLYTIDVASDELLLHTMPHRIDDARLLSFYYNNRAMELAVAGDPASEVWLRTAMASDDSHAAVWNNAGVMAQRRGDRNAAEQDFLTALKYNPKHTGALSNLVGFYRREGNTERSAWWQRRAERILRNDPFHQYLIGQQAEQRGDLAQALQHYRRAVRLDGNEHLFHFALARIHLYQGRSRQAGKELALAHDLSVGEKRNRYQAKLEKLRQMQH
ncbi:MAG: transglutaminase domain-containing protein [Pseudoxanthomonas sp.]